MKQKYEQSVACPKRIFFAKNGFSSSIPRQRFAAAVQKW